MADSCDFMVAPSGSLTGRLRVAGDKSISHRALLLGALAEGETRITNFLESSDCLATLEALRALGVEASDPQAGKVRVWGTGLNGLKPPSQALDCGNSGTCMRLLSGVLCGQPFTSTLTGDASLRRRPMSRVIAPLTHMGAHLQSRDGFAPLVIHGCRPLQALRHVLPVASAQVKSAILLAGLYAVGETWVQEPGTSRDHTERLLETMGCEVYRETGWIGVRGGVRLRGMHIEVPGDLSAAAFFMAGAAMQPDSHLIIENIGVNPSRDGIIHLLRRMGAEINLRATHQAGAEPVADMEIRGGELHGIEIAAHEVPLAIDEFPALLVAAAVASGTTTLHAASELRVKESDRLTAMAEGLCALGVPVELFEDGMRVTGVEHFNGGEINSFGDHRIAMAFAMAGLRARAPIRIRDCRNVNTSFPDFPVLARSAGLSIEVQETRVA